jgi:hypothetical protein
MDRYHFDAMMTPQDAADTYLPAFQSCIQRGNVSGLMCSYVLFMPCTLRHCLPHA